MNLKNLTPGQKHAIRRILTSTYGFVPITREVYTQLVKRAIVVKTDEVYERTEWAALWRDSLLHVSKS
jgi:hypothetical protein